MKHILLATDGSIAADVAAALAKAMGGRLSILTVGGNLAGDAKELARAEGSVKLSPLVLLHQRPPAARRRAHGRGPARAAASAGRRM